MSAVLQAVSISRSFGGVAALCDVSLAVEAGQMVGLIGPNGAGKTTLFNVLTGLTRPDAGQVRLAGRDVTRERPEAIAAMGLARTFQNIRLFPAMSAIDNIRVAGRVHARCGLVRSLLGVPAARREEREARERAESLLALVGLTARALDPAGALPYGERRKLEIARALALNPRVLLLDEPAAGMNPSERSALADFIRRLRERLPVSILLIEHHVPLVMGLCDKVAVLDFGQLLAEGPPEAVRRNPAVIKAYLGGDGHAPA